MMESRKNPIFIVRKCCLNFLRVESARRRPIMMIIPTVYLSVFWSFLCSIFKFLFYNCKKYTLNLIFLIETIVFSYFNQKSIHIFSHRKKIYIDISCDRFLIKSDFTQRNFEYATILSNIWFMDIHMDCPAHSYILCKNMWCFYRYD